MDDYESVRQKMAEALQMFGKVVHTSDNGSDALAVLATRAGEFDVVLLDMRMAGADGNYVLEHSPPKPPFIVHTGGPTTDIRPEFVGTKVVKILTKPYDVAELVEFIDEFIPCGRSDP